MQFFSGLSAAVEVTPAPAAPPGTVGSGISIGGNNVNMLYVFNRNGVCLLYRQWHRPLRTLDGQQDHKLMFGLLFSLRSFTAKMDPTSGEKGNLGVPLMPGQGCSFHSFRTNTYKLNFMESPSGIKVCNGGTGIRAGRMLPCLLGKHYLESGLKLLADPEWGWASVGRVKSCWIILVTHPKTSDLRDSLRHIYNLYVEYVVKNPLYVPGTPIRCELFNTNLDQYVKTLI